MQANHRYICAAACQQDAAEPDFSELGFQLVRANRKCICAAACQQDAAELDFSELAFQSVQANHRCICAAACQQDAAEPDFSELGVSMGTSKSQTASVQQLASKMPQNLTSLSLSFNGCRQITDTSVQQLASDISSSASSKIRVCFVLNGDLHLR